MTKKTNASKALSFLNNSNSTAPILLLTGKSYITQGENPATTKLAEQILSNAD